MGKRDRFCPQCNASVTDARRKFCSPACTAEAVRIRTRLRDDARIRPCPNCGKQKEPGKRRYCLACKEALLPVWRQQEYARSVEKNRRQVALRATQGRARVVRAGPDDTLRCAGCVEYLSKDRFATAGPGKYNSYCRNCYSHYLHDLQLRRNYGIDSAEYSRLLDLQDGRCAICLKQPRSRRLAVDHDHNSGNVRGLLCSRCNHKLLGGANDSVVMLNRAAAYLEAPPAITGESPDKLPAHFEQKLERAVEDAEDAHLANPDKPPVGFIDTQDGKQIAVMSGAMFLSVLKQYEKRVGVPLTITVLED